MTGSTIHQQEDEQSALIDSLLQAAGIEQRSQEFLNQLKPKLGDQLAVPAGKSEPDTWRIKSATWNEAFRLFQGNATNILTIAAAFAPHTDDLAYRVLANLLSKVSSQEDVTLSPANQAYVVLRSLVQELSNRGLDVPAKLNRDLKLAGLEPIPDTARFRVKGSEDLPIFGLISKDKVLSSTPTVVILMLCLIIYHSLAEWNGVREGLCDINGRLPEVRSLSDVRKAFRTTLCGAPASMVRIVSADNVNLRAGPGMKHRVVAQLKKGTAVAVVDSSDRDWLEVSIKIDDFVIEGWVSRKFLARVN